MNRRDRQFLTFAKNLLVEVRTLSFRLRETVEAIREQQRTQKETESPAPEMAAILNTRQSINTEQKASNGSQNSYQKKNLWIGVSGVENRKRQPKRPTVGTILEMVGKG